MGKNLNILRWSLLAGAVYFMGITLAHMFGLKVPLLFVYFNVPSYAYQDRIISFLAFGWSIFLFTAFIDPVKNSSLVKAILFAGSGAIIGLTAINILTDFNGLSKDIDVSIFWVETFGITAYVIWLFLFYCRSRNDL